MEEASRPDSGRKGGGATRPEWRLGHERSGRRAPEKRIKHVTLGSWAAMIHHPTFRPSAQDIVITGIVTGASHLRPGIRHRYDAISSSSIWGEFPHGCIDVHGAALMQ